MFSFPCLANYYASRPSSGTTSSRKSFLTTSSPRWIGGSSFTFPYSYIHTFLSLTSSHYVEMTVEVSCLPWQFLRAGIMSHSSLYCKMLAHALYKENTQWMSLLYTLTSISLTWSFWILDARQWLSLCYYKWNKRQSVCKKTSFQQVILIPPRLLSKNYWLGWISV